jgi:hypothetical protein
MAKRHSTAALACVLVLAGCGSSSSSSSTSTASAPTSTAPAASTPSGAQQMGSEGIPIEPGSALGDPGTTGTSKVDGITCGSSEQLAYHIHAHLAVFENGSLRYLPGGIGIPGPVVQQSTQGPVATGGKCIYWLHTHAPDGVIHVESPTQRVYTLGNFFNIWRQPLGRSQVAEAKGTVTAFVNGKPWTKDPRAIPLLPHAVIQISVGTPIVPFRSVSWATTGL